MAEETGSGGQVDIKIEIKEEPLFVEAATGESEHLDHSDDPLKEEIKDEEEVDVDLLKDEIIVGEPSCSSEEASRLHTGELSGLEASTSSCMTNAASQNEEKNANPTRKNQNIDKCEICNRSFMSASHLKMHSLTHARVTTYQCETCGKYFSSKGFLRKHVFTHKEIRPYKCETCGKTFNRVSNFRSHILIHRGAKNHKCGICGKAFIHGSTLRRHMVVHEDIPFVKCEVCGKSMREPKLQSHALIHANESKRDRFIEESKLEVHEGDQRYKCQICARTFPYLSFLKRHMPVHQDVAHASCDICGKTMKLSTLKTHYIFHAGTKYKCEICGKLFDDEPTRNSHVLNQECGISGENFARASSLRNHTFVHISDRTKLKQHSLAHAGTKSNSCSTCGKNFTSSSSLKKHVLMHTGIKPYHCETCGKSFTSNCILKRHSLKHNTPKTDPLLQSELTVQL